MGVALLPRLLCALTALPTLLRPRQGGTTGESADPTFCTKAQS
jgi:hypothetical protein